jgi:hypothetical protein
MPRHDKIGSLQVSDAVRRLNPHMFQGVKGTDPIPSSMPLVRYPSALEGVVPSPELAGPRYRSKWEAQFHEVLKARFPGAWIEYEPIRLRLAKNTTYTPDFLTLVVAPSMTGTGQLIREFTFWECKGFWRPAARVKIKVAASKYPWAKFVAVVKQKKKDGGGWKEEVFSP